MPTVTLTKGEQCQGRHVDLVVTGAWDTLVKIHVEDVLARPLSPEERIQFLHMYLRVYCQGKTLGQLNTAFTNGVVVTI